MGRRGSVRNLAHDAMSEAAPGRGSIAWSALSLWAPLATLAVRGRVDRLRMAWATSYRGPLLLYAADVWTIDVRRVCNALPWRDALTGSGFGRSNALPVGAFVGVARIDDCVLINKRDDEEFAEDVGSWKFRRGKQWRLRYDWMIGESAFLDPPIRSKGSKDLPVPHIGIFPVPLELGAEVSGRSVAVDPDPIPWPETDGTIVDIAISLHDLVSYAD